MNNNLLVFPDAFNHGLTKRELFAAMAMQGMLSANKQIDDYLIKESVDAADLLLKELNK